jgi:hypothetical protein
MEPSAYSQQVTPSTTHEPKPGTYSPVTVHQEDTVGAIFLGVVSLILLIVFVRAEARNRALLVTRGEAR